MPRLPAKTRGTVGRTTIGRSGPSRTHQGECGHHNDGQEQVPDTSLKLLRFPAVRERTGLSRSTIWRLERRGTCPRHHRISANAVAWLEDDIADWIRSKIRVAV